MRHLWKRSAEACATSEYTGRRRRTPDIMGIAGNTSCVTAGRQVVKPCHDLHTHVPPVAEAAVRVLPGESHEARTRP